MKIFVALMLVLVPLNVFGQTGREKYQEAKAAEFRSDHETGPNRVNEIFTAFQLMAEAALADPGYVSAFVGITRKYIARTGGEQLLYHDDYYLVKFIEVGQKRGNDPAFKAVAIEVANRCKRTLLRHGFPPNKPFVQVRSNRKRPYCHVPEHSQKIYEIFRFAYPLGSAEVSSWGKYAADTHMVTLKGCGGEGTDMEPDPFKAFPIYVAIKDQRGMRRAGKMAGDRMMFDYIFGGYEIEPQLASRPRGYRPFYDRATNYYRGGGVTKTEIRLTILRLQHEAEAHKNQNSIQLAEKTLTESF